MAQFAALRIAANIIEFIDFCDELFCDGRDLYKSRQGNGVKQLDLNTVSEDLKHHAQKLHSANQSSDLVTITEDEKGLRNPATDCERLSHELLSILDEVQVKERQNGIWESFIKALHRTMEKKKKSRSVEERLQRLREQVENYIIYLSSNQQSTIQSTIQDLINEDMRLRSNTTRKLDEMRTQLLKKIKEGQIDDFTGVLENLRALAEEAKDVKKRLEILRSLRFPSIKLRHEAIKLAHAETFKWIFQSPKSNFSEWLYTGSGVYWVQGKAGSGKSTLMRYLCEHASTESALEDWAKEYQSYIGSYFFWYAGTAMQKSQEGLLRTLLSQILTQCPDLIQRVCSIQWSAEESDDSEQWSRDNLFATFHELAKITQSSTKFCFFIDGLDEYYGIYQDLLLLLETLSSSSCIKICVSSRPWNVFLEAFGRSEQQLKLEDLTRDDINNYVQSRLGGNDKFRRLQFQDSSCNKIVNDIVKRAQGVFFWVSLVIDSLLTALIEGDDVAELRRRLDTLPSDLEKYFEHMIKNIEPFYRDETVWCFEIAVHALQPLPVLAYKFREEEKNNQDYALYAPIHPRSITGLDSMYQIMKPRLNARCKDLLEVTFDSSETSFMMYKVDFLHRTVRDFFLRTNTMEKLRKGSLTYDAHMSLCRIMLALTKSLPITRDFKPELNHMFSLVDELMYHAQEIESQCKHEPTYDIRHLNAVKLLDELDRVNIDHTKTLKVHWTNLRDVSKPQFKEYNQKTFLAATIQAKLCLYVQRKLDAKQLREKRGRPLLDYALRPNMVTPIELPDQETRPDVGMVRLLLDEGADPNQKVYIYDDETVWTLFLRLCYDNKNRRASPRSEMESKELYTVVEMMIRKGANPDIRFIADRKPVTVLDALRGFLTERELLFLKELSDQNRQTRFSSWKLSNIFGLR